MLSPAAHNEQRQQRFEKGERQDVVQATVEDSFDRQKQRDDRRGGRDEKRQSQSSNNRERERERAREREREREKKRWKVTMRTTATNITNVHIEFAVL